MTKEAMEEAYRTAYSQGVADERARCLAWAEHVEGNAETDLADLGEVEEDVVDLTDSAYYRRDLEGQSLAAGLIAEKIRSGATPPAPTATVSPPTGPSPATDPETDEWVVTEDHEVGLESGPPRP